MDRDRPGCAGADRRWDIDGLLVLGSRRRLQTPMLKELRRVLDETPATKLGFVLTGAGFKGGLRMPRLPRGEDWLTGIALSFFIEFEPAQRLARELSELSAGRPSPGGVA